MGPSRRAGSLGAAGAAVPTAFPTDPGGILQDYFTDLCFSLKRGDLKIFKKCEPPGTKDMGPLCLPSLKAPQLVCPKGGASSSPGDSVPDQGCGPRSPHTAPGPGLCPPTCTLLSTRSRLLPLPPRGPSISPGLSAADLEVLKQDSDSVSRRFYQNFLEDITELSKFVRQ